MNPNQHGRKDPALSDLEAFENLLRDSLHQDIAAAQPVAPGKVPMSKADHDAMAELARLVEPPLEFALPEFPDPQAAVRAAPEPNAPVAAALTPGWPPSTQPVRPAAAPSSDNVTEDSLAAFEEELRRFDASRLGMAREVAPAAPQAAYYSEPAFSAEPTFASGPVQVTPQVVLGAPGHAAAAASYQTPSFAEEQPYPESQLSPLEAMEQRLAADAAASYMQEEAPQGGDLRRSRSAFLTLGGIALAGLAVLGGVFSFGNARKTSPDGEIPLIAAKTEPAKERPADPGGVEIPNQNAQILSGRDVTKDTGPAKQVVNTTEQPIDLKEVTRRESVRIVSPSPFQPGGGTSATEAPQVSAGKPEVEARRVTSVRVPPGGEAAPAPAAGAATAATGAGTTRPATPPRSEAGANPAAERAVAAKPDMPKSDPAKSDAAKPEARPARKPEPVTEPVTEPVLADAAKTQANKQQAAKAKTSAAAQAVASTTPAVRAPEKVTPEKKSPEKKSPEKKSPEKKSPEKSVSEKASGEKVKHSAHAPMSLVDNPGGNAAAAPAKTASTSTFAVQLASRPTEADALAAATALGAKYSTELEGRPARVISGDANGQRVFRVRVGGYSREAATEACESIRASGGGLLRHKAIVCPCPSLPPAARPKRRYGQPATGRVARKGGTMSSPMRPLILGAGGFTLSDFEIAFYREHRPAGFILFRRNIDSPDQVRTLVAAMKAAAQNPAALILVDQEGGRVARLRPPHWPAYPRGADYGRLWAHDPDLAGEATFLGARLIADDLFRLGINVDCLPVLDVPVPGADSVIGDRAYARHPAPVMALGRAAAQGLLEGGVLPIIKHIPGHGRAMADSHLALPVVEAGRAELESQDFPPFRALGDCALAMTAHVIFTAYDRQAPATTSRRVIGEVIRGHMGFEGVLMCDDLSMKALSGCFASRRDAVLAAGCDLVLHCNGDPAEMTAIATGCPPLAEPVRERLSGLLGALRPGAFEREAAQQRLAELLATGL